MMDVRLNYDIDIRAELTELMRANSYEVLVQRTSRKIRCKCFNEKYQESDSKCPMCLGLGWLFKFEKVKTFKQDIRAAIGNAIISTDIGRLTNENQTFFFEHNCEMNEGDYIWEVAWKNGMPISLVNLFKIEAILDKRGDNGRVEFKVVIAKKESIDKDFKNMYIGKAWKDVTS